MNRITHSLNIMLSEIALLLKPELLSKPATYYVTLFQEEDIEPLSHISPNFHCTHKIH